MGRIKAITIEDDEEFLRQISVPVNLDDKELKNDISILEEFCNENDVMAMAAVQLGIPKRIVYLKNTNIDIINKMQANTATKEEENLNEARVLINPVIKSREGITDYWEACASCLDNFGHVRRPYKIVVEYYDLDGILHMDIADEVLVLSKEERKRFRQKHGYNIISKTGKYEDLLKGSTKN